MNPLISVILRTVKLYSLVWIASSSLGHPVHILLLETNSCIFFHFFETFEISIQRE